MYVLTGLRFGDVVSSTTAPSDVNRMFGTGDGCGIGEGLAGDKVAIVSVTTSARTGQGNKITLKSDTGHCELLHTCRNIKYRLWHACFHPFYVCVYEPV